MPFPRHAVVRLSLCKEIRLRTVGLIYGPPPGGAGAVHVGRLRTGRRESTLPDVARL